MEEGGKGALRRRLREARAGWAVRERASASWALFQRVREQSWWRAAGEVAAFVGMADELDTLPWLEAARDEGKAVWLPRVASMKERRLSWARFEGTSALVAGPWGLREPPPSTEEGGLGRVEVVLVPGLAFDAQGVRLGLGGGFYDRALAPFGALQRPVRVGVCAHTFLAATSELPLEAHDVRMHVVVTDLVVLDCSMAQAG